MTIHLFTLDFIFFLNMQNIKHIHVQVLWVFDFLPFSHIIPHFIPWIHSLFSLDQSIHCAINTATCRTHLIISKKKLQKEYPSAKLKFFFGSIICTYYIVNIKISIKYHYYWLNGNFAKHFWRKLAHLNKQSTANIHLVFEDHSCRRPHSAGPSLLHCG